MRNPASLIMADGTIPTYSMKFEKDVVGLGAVGIVRQAFKLFRTYFKVLILIQLTLMLPVLIWFEIADTLVGRYIEVPHSMVLPGIVHILHVKFQILLQGGTTSHQFGRVVNILLTLFNHIVVQSVLASLSTSAILYTVGLHYTGQSVSFRGVLRASIPRLWMRLTITEICEVLTLCAVDIFSFHVLPADPLSVSSPKSFTVPWVLPFVVLCTWYYCIRIIFAVAKTVSVLENSYGWAALRTSIRLLSGTKIRAVLSTLLCILLLGIVPRLFDFVPLFVLGLKPMTFGSTVIYICQSNSLQQIDILCTGVQYALCKAHHNEDLAEGMYVSGQTMRGTWKWLDGAKRTRPNRSQNEHHLGH